MIKADFPYSGFWLLWSFYSNNDSRYTHYTDEYIVPPNIYEDLNKVMSILGKYELFYPTYFRNDKGENINFKSSDIDCVLTTLQEHVSRKEITFEIQEIGGYGIVYQSETNRVIQEDLLSLDSIRFIQRQINVATTKSIWVPVSIDKSYTFEWQVTLARLNAPRLESCLREIYHTLRLDVEPAENELYSEDPIWQKGFKLFLNPYILEREFKDNPPADLSSLDEFLIS